MAEDKLREVLFAAASNVLETMFFTMPLGMSDTGADGNPMAARVRFEGLPSGFFALALSEPAARALAINFLGEESDIDAAQVREVIGELANMMCGLVLSRLEPDAAFEIRHPTPVPAGQPAAGPEAASCSLDLGDGVLTA